MTPLAEPGPEHAPLFFLIVRVFIPLFFMSLGAMLALSIYFLRVQKQKRKTNQAFLALGLGALAGAGVVYGFFPCSSAGICG